MNQKGRSNSRYHSNAVRCLLLHGPCLLPQIRPEVRSATTAQTRNLVVHITSVLLSMGLSPFCERTATDQRRIKSTKAKGSIFALKNSPPASAGFGFGKASTKTLIRVTSHCRRSSHHHAPPPLFPLSLFQNSDS